MDKVNQSVLKLLTRVGMGYLDDRLNRLGISASGSAECQSAEGFSPKVVVLGRQHYQEFVRSFPLDSAAEVRKLLRLEYADQTNVCYRLWPAADGHTQVNIWQWQWPQGSEAAQQASVVLPVSAVLAESIKPMSVLVAQLPRVERTLFVARKPSGIVSARQGGMLQTAGHFQMSSGLQVSDDALLQFTPQQTLATLVNTLPGFLLRYGQIFWHQRQGGGFAWQPLVGAALVLFCSYLALGSGYLGIKSMMLDSEIAEQRAEVNQALDVQNRYNQLASVLAQGQAFSREQVITSDVWTVLIPLMHDVKFSRIQYRNQRFVIRGDTDKATDILSRLLSLPQIAEAKFDSQVQRNRSKETFVISFTLKEADNGNA